MKVFGEKAEMMVGIINDSEVDNSMGFIYEAVSVP